MNVGARPEPADDRSIRHLHRLRARRDPAAVAGVMEEAILVPAGLAGQAGALPDAHHPRVVVGLQGGLPTAGLPEPDGLRVKTYRGVLRERISLPALVRRTIRGTARAIAWNWASLASSCAGTSWLPSLIWSQGRLVFVANVDL